MQDENLQNELSFGGYTIFLLLNAD